MKKGVALLFIFGLFAGMVTPVFAQVPTPTPREGGSHNTIVQMELDTSTAVKALAGTLVGFNVAGDVIPLVVSPNTLNYTNMAPFNIWLKPAFTNLQSGWYTANNKIIPFTEANVESAKYCAKLTINSPYTNPSNLSLYYLTENTTQISQNIPWTQDLYTYAQLLGSVMSGYRKTANAEGKLEYNKPKDILAKIYKDDCGGTAVGVERSPASVDVTSRAVFPAGSAIQGAVSVTQYVQKLIDGVLTWVLDTLDIKMKLVLWKKSSMSWSGFLCLLGYGCGIRESADVVTKHSITPDDGFSAMWVSAKQKKDNVGPGSESNAVKILGSVSEEIKYQNPETGINKAYEGMRQSACSFTAYNLIPDYKIGGTIPIADACTPPSPTPPPGVCLSSWGDITKNLKGAAGKAARTYAQYFPISKEQLQAMLNVIFDIEVRNDNTLNPDLGGTWSCQENSATAAGPFQIKTGTYKSITNNCTNEYINDDIKNCTAPGLSRCDVFDAAELAVRALLFSAGRWVYTPNQCGNNRAVKISSLSELYTAVCNFGTGVGVPMPNLGGKTYCEYVFDAVGLPKP